MANWQIDCTGSPPSLWLLALQYVCYILNHTSCPSLDFNIPIAILTGSTPDISIIMQFSWYEKVYFKANESTFPSESTEEAGHFVGFAETVGNALTYKVLTSTGKVLSRSSIRSADDTTHINVRAENAGSTDEISPIRSSIDDHVDNNQLEGRPMAIVDPEDLVG